MSIGSEVFTPSAPSEAVEEALAALVSSASDRGVRIVREIAEEVGLVATVDQLVGVFAREAGVHDNPHSVVSVVYLCDAIGGELRAQPHEVREIAWRAIDDVDDWHHHHETLARAALEAHWRRAATDSRSRPHTVSPWCRPRRGTRLTRWPWPTPACMPISFRGRCRPCGRRENWRMAVRPVDRAG